MLATGAQNRKLPVPGADSDGVLYLRTLADADAIKERFHAAQSIVVAGAGFIGLELAAVASKFGKQVTVVEALSRCMSRAVSPAVSQFFAEAHAAWGNHLLLDTRIAGIESANGPRHRRHHRRRPHHPGRPRPGRHRHRAGGLAGAGGGAHARQRHRRRCAPRQLRSGHLGHRRLRLVPRCRRPASASGSNPCRTPSTRAAASPTRIAGKAADYAAVPWFWSDQRDLKLQMVGLTAGCDRTVLRGDPAARAFSVFCFNGDRLIGIESINRAADHMFGRRLLGAGQSITPEEAADPSFDFKARLATLPRAAAPVAAVLRLASRRRLG